MEKFASKIVLQLDSFQQYFMKIKVTIYIVRQKIKEKLN